MGKKAQSRRASTARAVEVQHALRTGANIPLLVLSVLGAGLTGYMAWTALGGGSVRGCSAGSDCDVVLTSDWSTFLGLPTSLWGFLTYVTLAAIAFVKRADHHWQYAWTISFFGVLFSLYLTTVSLTMLDAACPYCLTSLGIMSLIFVVTTLQRPATIPGFSWNSWLPKTGAAALGIILVMHLGFTGFLGSAGPPENPIAKPLAEHLAKTGAKMYGAFWCPHCQDQKKIFGSAAKLIPYIECSPEGRGSPQAEVCQAEKVNSYPTWVINGTRREAVLSLPELATASGFQAPPMPAPATN